jgi:hypothetical protein
MVVKRRGARKALVIGNFPKPFALRCNVKKGDHQARRKPWVPAINGPGGDGKCHRRDIRKRESDGLNRTSQPSLATNVSKGLWFPAAFVLDARAGSWSPNGDDASTPYHKGIASRPMMP